MTSSSLVFLASTRDLHGDCRLSRSDAAALEGALRSASGAMAYCPPNDIAAAELALAAGVSDVRVLGDRVEGDFEVAWIGAGAIEAKGDLFAAQIAEDRDAALIFDVLTCDRVHDGWNVTRDAGRGARDILIVTGPIVAVVSNNAPRPVYISRHRRQVARPRLGRQFDGKQADTPPKGPSPLSGTGEKMVDWHLGRPRTRITVIREAIALGADDRMNSAFGIELSARGGNAQLAADAETCARELLRYLMHHEFIERLALPADTEPPTPLAQDRSPASSPAIPLRSDARPNALSAPSASKRRGPRQAGETDARRFRRPRQLADAPARVRTPGYMARRPRPVAGNAPASRGPFFFEQQHPPVH